MKIFALPTVGLIGGIAFASWGVLPFLASAIPAEFLSHVTQERLIRIPDSECLRTRNANSIESPQFTESDKASDRSATEATLRDKVERLERGRTFLNTIPAYTAEFHKQEVVRGELLGEQTIYMKCRHKPFSVYLLWMTGDTGREVIYIDGANRGKMIAHDGGWKARIPAFHLSIDSSLAMRDARYPVTTAGLLGLIEIMDGVHQNDLRCQNFESCELDLNQPFDGRSCDVFITKYRSAIDSPVYRKSITWIDREWNVPLHSQHFEWPSSRISVAEAKLDEATLIESYSFTDIALEPQLSDRDFDRANPDYRFR